VHFANTIPDPLSHLLFHILFNLTIRGSRNPLEKGAARLAAGDLKKPLTFNFEAA
jgi:hypothetical protein